MTTPRRDFLTALAATAATTAAGGLPSLLGAAPTAAPFDDSWATRVKAAKHKIVFDAPEPNDGLAFTQPWVYRRGYEVMGSPASDIATVVVLRHAAASLALDDALWAKYKLGALRKIDDPMTKQPAERNPWSRATPGKAPDADMAAILGPGIDSSVEGVIRSGGIVLVCNLAIGRIARGLARASNQSPETVHAELRDGVVPGVLVQPSGVYATARAQEVGAVFLRST